MAERRSPVVRAVDGSDEVLDGWYGGAAPEPREGGVVSSVGINQGEAALAVDPEATASQGARVGARARAGTALTVERLGEAPDPGQPRPSGRVRLRRH